MTRFCVIHTTDKAAVTPFAVLLRQNKTSSNLKYITNGKSGRLNYLKGSVRLIFYTSFFINYSWE